MLIGEVGDRPEGGCCAPGVCRRPSGGFTGVHDDLPLSAETAQAVQVFVLDEFDTVTKPGERLGCGCASGPGRDSTRRPSRALWGVHTMLGRRVAELCRCR